jgi:hypothetical protein
MFDKIRPSLNSRFVLLAAVLIVAAPTNSYGQKTASTDDTLPDWLGGPYLNVVLSLNNEAKMREFYGDILKLDALRDLTLAPRRGRPMAVTMVRYQLGVSQIKMIIHPDISRPPGGRSTANGLRLLSIPVVKGNELAARLQKWNGTKIEWQQETDYKIAWVKDPDDNEIELRWYPESASHSEKTRLELCLTVGNMEKSREHYGEHLGLPPLPTVEKAGFSGQTYQYKVGKSVLRLWSSGKELPTDSGWTKDGYGLRYVQFVVKDVYGFHEHLVDVGAAIAQGPTPLGGRTALMFAQDPDGVINECVGPGK